MSAPRTVVEVAVPRPLRDTFDYAVAADQPVPPIGARVYVPFGRSTALGIVTGHRTTSTHELKAISEVIDATPLLTPDLIELAQWLARYYHHPIGSVLSTMLPAKARRGAAAMVAEEAVWEATGEGCAEAALRRAPRQLETWRRLRELRSLPEAEARSAGLERHCLSALLAKGLAARRVVDPDYGYRTLGAVTPNAEQQAAIDAVAASLGGSATHLLDGVTGSGKTEVYLRVIAAALARGQQALVLVPEIALTPQTAARFRERFGAAATLHSLVSDAQRFDIWLKCASGSHKVLIGTRSAVFAPFQDLGVIVVDEEHDGSFKQTDGLRYSARDVAVKRAQGLGIPVLLGSATPSLESLRNVHRGRYGLMRLASRPGGASMPILRTLDIRGERLQQGFSAALLAAVERHLDAGGQVLVFINRRGYAPVLLCAACAWQARCPHCDVRLTLHVAPEALRCHQCGYRRPVPRQCPDCGSGEFVRLGVGTQRVAEALAEIRPDVPLYRIDSDTTRSMRRLESDLAAIRAGRPAILVGTQMLAKGHHLPNVTLVAVLDADAGFLSPDFRAAERTAQVITQVAGRAGRAERPGEVLIQTYDPANAHLAALIAAGYRGFAQSESRLRAEASMPPFAAMALVRADSLNETAAGDFLASAAPHLKGVGVEVLGPAPAPLARRADRYRYQLCVLAARRGDLHRALDRLEAAEPRTSGVRWAVDVDPLDAF